MSLDSTSTNAEVVAAYLNNASYSEDNSIAKAKTFITACRILLLKKPKRIAHGGEEVEIDMQLIKQELDAAKIWVAARDGLQAGAGVTRLSFEDFRS